MASKSFSEGKKMVLCSEALKAFVIQKQVDGLSHRSVEFYQRKLSMFVAFVIDKPVRDLTLQDGQNWVLHLSSRNRYVGHPLKKEVAGPMSKATLRGYIRALKVWASYLYEEGYTKANVFARIRLPADTNRVVEILSEEEIVCIFGAINQGTKLGARMHAVLSLLLDTGMRIGELERIAFQDIDFRQHRIKITGKGDKERFVPFGVTTSKAILAWYNMWREDDGDERLFQMCQHSIAQCMKRLGRKVGIERLHPHLWRHTFAVRWLRNGGDVFSLQRVLGHSDLEVTKVYIHLAEVDIEDKHRLVSPVDRLGLGKRQVRKTGT
jgi:site-specific recombinase XerD